MQAYRVSLVYSFGVGAVLGLALMFFWRRLPAHLYARPRSYRGRHGKASDHGLELRILGVHGQYARCLARGLGKSAVPMAIVILWLVCVPRDLGVYDLRHVPHADGAVPSLHLSPGRSPPSARWSLLPHLPGTDRGGEFPQPDSFHANCKSMREGAGYMQNRFQGINRKRFPSKACQKAVID